MDIKSNLFLFVLSALCSVVLSDKKDFANNLLNCARVNPNFDQCLRATLEEVRTYMPVGFPEFGLGPSEPLKINNLNFMSKPSFGGTVAIDAKFTNVIVEGLSNFITQEIKADTVERTLKLKMRVPRINIRGHYKTSGKVLVLELNGNGPFYATLYDAVGEGFGRIVPTGPPNNRSLSIKNTNIDFRIGRVNITLDNLFDGKFPALADTTNAFLNSNSDMIIEEIKPQIKFEVSRLFETVMADAFSKLPVEDFLNVLPSQPRQVPRSNRSLRGRNPMTKYRAIGFRH